MLGSGSTASCVCAAITDGIKDSATAANKVRMVLSIMPPQTLTGAGRILCFFLDCAWCSQDEGHKQERPRKRGPFQSRLRINATNGGANPRAHGWCLL